MYNLYTMNITTTIDQYNNNNVFFGELQQNNVIHDCNFMRLIYSTEYFSLNGIFFIIEFKNVTIEKYFSKYKCSFSISENKKLISDIINIETNILNKLPISSHNLRTGISSQLECGNIKMFSCSEPKKGNLKIILKLSGIWQNGSEHGITYKFIPID